MSMASKEQMTNRDGVSAFLVLSGDSFDPRDCSRAVGLEPTKIWQQRREDLARREELANTEWMVGFEKQPFDCLSEAVSAVLARVWEHREGIREYAEQHGLAICMVCNVTIWENAPEYSLTSKVMQRLSELDADFLLDIFDYRGDEDESA